MERTAHRPGTRAAQFPGATVAVTWADLSVDRAILEVRREQRDGSVVVDSLGQYRLCGVPTENALLVQVQHAGRAGSALRAMVREVEGLAVRTCR